jgi:integrase
MTRALFDQRGNRKYLVARERLAFVCAASEERAAISTFCLTLAFTGARISEVLALRFGCVFRHALQYVIGDSSDWLAKRDDVFVIRDY